MEELDLLHKKNGEILDSNEWNKLVSIINYIIEFYNHYPTKLSEFENDIVDLFIGPKGDLGDKGDIGPLGPKGEDGSISFEELTEEQKEILRGPQGELGIQGETGPAGLNGSNGKSAYDIAVENGFEGTEQLWLDSLIGAIGKSAYLLALDAGFSGTLLEWLESLKGQDGQNGSNGKSAYQLYLDITSDDPILSEADWLASLKGPKGDAGTTPHIDLTTGNWFIGNIDTGVHAQGPAGQDGDVAGQIQVDWNQTDNTSVDFIKNKPTLFSGSYNDLSDKPIIPDVLIQSDWNLADSTAKDFIKNKPIIPSKVSDLLNDSEFLQSPINNNGHDYVEIGGIKWATMNVGASSITDYGLYFQWGDTQGYTSELVGTGSELKYFGWGDYKYHEGTPKNNGYDPDIITKYDNNDNLKILQISDDAVNAAWGGDWRMPTRDEFLNLREHTTVSWVTNYQNSGINGKLFVDKTDSSKVLFFPAAGDIWFGAINQIGQSGFYWVSDNYSKSLACNISFDNNSFATYDTHYKYNGFSIRGICDCSNIASKVAVTGDYNDLINKPVIPGGGTVVQSNWNETDTSSPAYILNKPTIPTVPTNYITTDTQQSISGTKTFTGGINSIIYTGHNPIKFKAPGSGYQTTGFTFFNSSDSEKGYVLYNQTKNTMFFGKLHSDAKTGFLNEPGLNVVEEIYIPTPGETGVWYIPVKITDGTTTVSAGSNGTVNMSSFGYAKVWNGTQAEYNALSSYDSNTIYIIT